MNIDQQVLLAYQSINQLKDARALPKDLLLGSCVDHVWLVIKKPSVYKNTFDKGIHTPL